MMNLQEQWFSRCFILTRFECVNQNFYKFRSRFNFFLPLFPLIYCKCNEFKMTTASIIHEEAKTKKSLKPPFMSTGLRHTPGIDVGWSITWNIWGHFLCKMRIITVRIPHWVCEKHCCVGWRAARNDTHSPHPYMWTGAPSEPPRHPPPRCFRGRPPHRTEKSWDDPSGI